MLTIDTKKDVLGVQDRYIIPHKGSRHRIHISYKSTTQVCMYILPSHFSKEISITMIPHHYNVRVVSFLLSASGFIMKSSQWVVFSRNSHALSSCSSFYSSSFSSSTCNTYSSCGQRPGSATTFLLKNITTKFILTDTQHPGNVGAVARAMKTM